MAENLPGSAYLLRPYAYEKLIFKKVRVKNEPRQFIIDPWTQYWIIAEESVAALLRLANGRRRLSEIIRQVSALPAVTPPSSGFVSVVDELFNSRLLFHNLEEHRAAGTPVYNSANPVGFHLEITNACNMTCQHCYVSSGKKHPNELTLEEIKKTIDMLPPFSGKRVAISGGEPAVRKDCPEIVDYCVIECGHDVDLYTNGKKFPVSLAQHLLELNRKHQAKARVQVSLEGATAETNDAVRGLGSFAATMKTLRMFQEIGLNRSCVIFVCVTNRNIGELDEIIGLAESLDVSMLVFSQWQKQGNASDTPWSAVGPSAAEWVAAGEKLLKYTHPRLKVYGNFYGDLRNNAEGRFSLDGRLFPKQVYFYNSFPRITPEGKIFADQLWVEPSWIVGDVRTMSLDSAFETTEFHSQMESFRARASIPECSECEWLSLCEGGSAGHTYAEYGDLNHKDVFCESRILWFNRYVDHRVQELNLRS